MRQGIQKNFQRYFKIYFILALLAFTVAVVLMNIPRVLAGEPAAPKDPARAIQEEKGDEGTDLDLKKLYRWSLSSSTSHGTLQETYMEFHGNKMFLKFRF